MKNLQFNNPNPAALDPNELQRQIRLQNLLNMSRQNDFNRSFALERTMSRDMMNKNGGIDASLEGKVINNSIDKINNNIPTTEEQDNSTDKPLDYYWSRGNETPEERESRITQQGKVMRQILNDYYTRLGYDNSTLNPYNQD